MILQFENNVHAETLYSTHGIERAVPSDFSVYPTQPFNHEPGRLLMLNVIVRSLGDTTIFHCAGRILSGDKTLYGAAVAYASGRTLVLDLAHVQGIDAGGLGMLLELRQWTEANGIQLKLCNVAGSAQQVLEFTRLNRIFEICSSEEIACLPARSRSTISSTGRLDRSSRQKEESGHAQNLEG